MKNKYLNNKGYVFIETIVVIVLFTAGLILLYKSYSSSIQNEKERLFFNDVAYYYRTKNIKKYLDKYSNLEYIKQNGFGSDTYIITIGPDTNDLFVGYKNYRETFRELNDFNHVHQILLIKSNFIDECYESNEKICQDSLANIDYDLKDYILSLNSSKRDFYLVVVYQEQYDKPNLDSCEKFCNQNDFNCVNGKTKNCKSNFTVIGA